MPYSGAGVYSFPPGSLPSDGETIDAVDVVTPFNDLLDAQNAARPVVAGGTGSSTASGARTNLGLAIGTNVQAYDPGLQSIASLTTAADQMVYLTGADTYAVTTLTSYARTLLDDTDASTARGTLGVGDGFQINAPVESSDFDDINQSGLHYANGFTVANEPGTANRHGIVHVRIDGNDQVQFAVDVTTNYAYTRAKSSGVWSAWQALSPAARRYTSPEQTITTAGSITLAHGLGVAPTRLSGFLVCQTADGGYVAGEEIYCPPTFLEGLTGASVLVDATNLTLRYPNRTNVFGAYNKSTGNTANLTNANWRYKIIAEV